MDQDLLIAETDACDWLERPSASCESESFFETPIDVQGRNRPTP